MAKCVDECSMDCRTHGLIWLMKVCLRGRMGLWFDGWMNVQTDEGTDG